MKTELTDRLTISILKRLTEFAIKYLQKYPYDLTISILDITNNRSTNNGTFLCYLGAEYAIKTQGEEVDHFIYFDKDMEKIAVVDNGE